MNCQQTLDMLSPLHDGELSADHRESVEQHIRECSSCAEALADFKALSSLVRDQSDTDPPADLWDQLESVLDADSTCGASVAPTGTCAPTRTWREHFRSSSRTKGVVAAALIAVFGFAIIIHNTTEHGHDEHLAVNFDQFLSEFPKSPENAQKLLHANYPSDLVDVHQAALEVKYRPAVANALPEGYTLDTVHLVRMPCCLCVEALCTAPDGTRLAVLEHDVDQPVWFGDRPTEQCDCNGRAARLVRFDGRLAATWKSEKRFLTIIGIRDEEELASMMQHLDPPEA